MKNTFKRERTITSVSEVNKLIDPIKKLGLRVVRIGIGGDYLTENDYLVKNNNSLSLNESVIIELKPTKLLITTKYNEAKKPTTFVFELNGQHIASISGQACFARQQRFYKIPKASDYNLDELNAWFNEEKGNYACSASPLIGYNEKYNNTEIKDCYEYDLNSAYTAAIYDHIPDLFHPHYEPFHKVQKGHVGFIIDDQLTMIEAGKSCDISFQLIETPKELKKFFTDFYELKSKSIGVDKKEAKAMLNYPIGYSQRYNPFFRAYIVHKCNKYIKKFMDKDTVIWNTDAIYSKRKRNDLPIGDGIGQFKETHFKFLRYNGNNYQIEDELPVYRGVPKNWFKAFKESHGRAFNILVDELPEKRNLYNWNWEKLRLEKNYD